MRAVLVNVVLFFTFAAVSAQAASVFPHRGTSPPGNRVFAMEGEYFFSLNADSQTYSNRCDQLAGFGCGAMTLDIDGDAGEIFVVADRTNVPEMCITLWDPVNGIVGNLGALADGNWVLHGLFGEYVGFTVGQPASTGTETGDFDGDGDVDAQDLGMWEGGYGAGDHGDGDADEDSDGLDFLIWQRSYTGSQTTLAVGTVPEPTSLALLAVAALIPLGRTAFARRRRCR